MWPAIGCLNGLRNIKWSIIKMRFCQHIYPFLATAEPKRTGYLMVATRSPISTSTSPLSNSNATGSFKESTVELVDSDNHRVKKQEKYYYISTPIYYVNSKPHIGHMYTSVIADFLARWKQLHSNGKQKVILATGTDEHGLKIQQAAKNVGFDTLKFCDQVSSTFKVLFDRANVSYTDFIRTSETKHKETVTEIWNRLEKEGYIYKGRHEGWYSVSDESFCLEADVEQVLDPQTGKKSMIFKQSGHKVEWMSEENYKFRLSAFKDDLVKWLTETPSAVYPRNRLEEVLDILQSPYAVQDLSVSRPKTRVQWGIPVPGDPNQVIYVWLDALYFMRYTGHHFLWLSKYLYLDKSLLMDTGQ